jgi:hypothetical protein
MTAVEPTRKRPGPDALAEALDKVDAAAEPLQRADDASTEPDPDDAEAYQNALEDLARIVGAFLGRPLDLIGFAAAQS